MSTDFEQRLRAEMEQVAVNPRPGLVKAAYRSYRGKRRLTRALAATGTAMAIAAGTAAAVTASPASPAAIPSQTTAYVASHVASALTANDEILYVIESDGPPGHPNGAIYSWNYGIRSRILQVNEPGGQPVIDNWGKGWGLRRGDATFVFYSQRYWSYETWTNDPPAPPPTCQTYKSPLFPFMLQTGTENPGSEIASGLRCGAFQVAGHQRVDGIDTIKLIGSKFGGHPSFTLWVNARTYLPVQVTGNQLVMQFRWLPPTQANLAKLTGPIPPGFPRQPA